jgi:cytosine/adenosine deaminase-related metal-dependent hydrolase
VPPEVEAERVEHADDGYAFFWAYAGTPGDAVTWKLRSRLQQMFRQERGRPPVIHVPERREPVARSRERRARRSSSSSSGEPSPADEPPLAPRRVLTAAERRVLKILVDRRRREVIAAGIQLTEADRALFADDIAEQQSVG